MSPSRRGAILVAIIGLLLPVATAGAVPSRTDLVGARDRLMEIEREFQLVVEEYNAVSEGLQQIQYEMAEKQLVARSIERRMLRREEAAVALAVELYMGGGTEPAVESVLSSRSLGEIETRVQYLQSSNAAQVDLFSDLARDQELLDTHLASLEDKKAEALAAETRMEELRAEVEARLAAQEDEVRRLNRAVQRAELVAFEAAAVRPGELPDLGPFPPAPPPHDGAAAAVDAALSQLGKPYKWAAVGPDSYDCSGLTMWAWAGAGVALPHNSGMQYAATTRLDVEDWQPGDLLFFGSPIHHVGMYIGNGEMVEAPYTGAQVRIGSAYRSDYAGAGRPGG